MQGYGYIESYVHGNQIGVLVQLSCPDSFALKTAEFVALAKDIAMHIAASKPVALEPSKLDPSIRNAELAHYKQQLSTMSEKERIERIQNINDRINRDLCLYLQPFIKDPAQTVGEHIENVASQLGVGIQVVRFARWEQNET